MQYKTVLQLTADAIRLSKVFASSGLLALQHQPLDLLLLGILRFLRLLRVKGISNQLSSLGKGLL